MAKRLFYLPQLQSTVYRLLQELRQRHDNATQWEIISAALVVFGQYKHEDRERALAEFRGQAPSDTPPHEIAK